MSLLTFASFFALCDENSSTRGKRYASTLNDACFPLFSTFTFCSASFCVFGSDKQNGSQGLISSSLTNSFIVFSAP